MSKLLDFLEGKKKVKDLITDPCCNNCLNGSRNYLFGSESFPEGIACSVGINNGKSFRYICDSYEKDKEFIEFNKELKYNK